MSETDAGSDPPEPTYRRWLVLGAGGSGKSRFSIELADILGVPLIHLDRHYWRPGWVESPRDEWREKVAELCSGEEWVIDGNYSGSLDLRLQRAEAAVLLDVSTWQSVAGVFARSLGNHGSTRPDMADGCEERIPDPEFLWFVLSYKWRSRPKVLRRIGEARHVRLHRFTSRRGAKAFLRALRDGCTA